MNSRIFILLIFLFIQRLGVAQLLELKKVKDISFEKIDTISLGSIEKIVPCKDNKSVIFLDYEGHLCKLNIETGKFIILDSLLELINYTNYNKDNLILRKRNSNKIRLYNLNDKTNFETTFSDSNATSYGQLTINSQQHFAIGYDDGFLKIGNKKTKSVKTFKTNLPGIYDIIPWNKNEIILASDQGKLGVLNLKNNSTRILVQDESDEDYTNVEIVNDSLFVTKGYQTVYFWNSKKRIQAKEFPSLKTHTRFSVNGKTNSIALAINNQISLYDIKTGDIKASIDISNEINSIEEIKVDNKKEIISSIINMNNLLVVYLQPFWIIIYEIKQN